MNNKAFKKNMAKFYIDYINDKEAIKNLYVKFDWYGLIVLVEKHGVGNGTIKEKILSRFPNEKVYGLSCDEMVAFFNEAVSERLFLNKYVNQKKNNRKEKQPFYLKLTTKNDQVIM